MTKNVHGADACYGYDLRDASKIGREAYLYRQLRRNIAINESIRHYGYRATSDLPNAKNAEVVYERIKMYDTPQSIFSLADISVHLRLCQ